MALPNTFARLGRSETMRTAIDYRTEPLEFVRHPSGRLIIELRGAIERDAVKQLAREWLHLYGTCDLYHTHINASRCDGTCGYPPSRI